MMFYQTPKKEKYMINMEKMDLSRVPDLEEPEWIYFLRCLEVEPNKVDLKKPNLL